MQDEEWKPLVEYIKYKTLPADKTREQKKHFKKKTKKFKYDPETNNLFHCTKVYFVKIIFVISTIYTARYTMEKGCESSRSRYIHS